MLGSYEDTPNQTATWFIDPPYQIGGHFYKESNKNIDFKSLGQWCKTREGQVMVCEKIGADWMDFKLLAIQQTKNGIQNEAIWTNQVVSYRKEQGKLDFTLYT